MNEQLIEAVKKNTILFDVTAKDYRNIAKKQEIWSNIGESLNCSAETCRKKWKHLRDTHRKRRRHNDLAIANGKPIKKWKFTNAMKFMDQYLDTKLTQRSVREIESSEEETSADDIDDGTGTDSWPFIDVKIEPTALRVPKESSINQLADDELLVNDKFADKMSSQTGNATAELFMALANRLSTADITKAQLMAVEAKVVALVYGELAKHTKS